MIWQIYRKPHPDTLGHLVGIIPEGFKLPAYTKLIEVYEGTREQAIERAKVIENSL